MGRKKKDEQNGHAEAAEALPNPETVPGAKKIGSAFTQDLPVKNTDAQQVVIAGQLADVILEKGRVEAEKLKVQEEKKAELAELQEKIDELEVRERELARDVHNGTHQEPIECVEYLLPDNRVMAVRTDTSEVLEERTAEAEDLQPDLFDGEDRDAGEGNVDEETKDESLGEDHELEQETPGP